MKWILDTNVLSETRKLKQSKSVVSWIASIEVEAVFTTAVNIAELRYGALQNTDQLAHLEISNWIEQKIRPWFDSRILDVDETVLVNWRALSRRNQIAKLTAPPVDMLIAAIAFTFGMGVVTRDVAPFVACGIPTLNPWTGESFNGA